MLEQQFEEGGWLASEACYDDSGKLKWLSVSEDDFTQSYDWFADGAIEKLVINDRKGCSIV